MLSTAQQNKIVQLLGYGGKSLDVGSVLYDSVLANRLLNLNADAEALVVGYLNTIAALETQIAAAPTRLIASQVADIKINLDEIEKLRRERKRQTRELAALIDIPYIGPNGNNINLVV